MSSVYLTGGSAFSSGFMKGYMGRRQMVSDEKERERKAKLEEERLELEKKRAASDLLSAEESRESSKASRELSVKKYNDSKVTPLEKMINSFKSVYPDASEEELGFVRDVFATKAMGLSTDPEARDLTGKSYKKAGGVKTTSDDMAQKEALKLGQDLQKSRAAIAKLYQDKAALEAQIASNDVQDVGQLKAIETAIEENERIHQSLKKIWRDAPLGSNPQAQAEFDNKRLEALEAQDISARQVQTWRDKFKSKQNAKEISDTYLDELAGTTPPTGQESFNQNGIYLPEDMPLDRQLSLTGATDIPEATPEPTGFEDEEANLSTDDLLKEAEPEQKVRQLATDRPAAMTPESAANIWGHRSGANFEGFAENYLEVEAKKLLTARNTGGRSTLVKNLSVVNDVIPELIDEAKANGELAGASKMEITLWAREKAQELVDRLASEYKVVALKK